MLKTVIGGVVVGVLIAGIFAVILGLPLMLLWNALMPDMFGLMEISFWQAVGLNFLSGILFKSNSSNSSTSNRG